MDSLKERAMKKLDVLSQNSIPISERQELPKPMLNKLYRFLNTFYHVGSEEELRFIFKLQPQEQAEITVLYGMNDDLAGFTHTRKQHILWGGKKISTYLSFIYHHPDYKVLANISQMGLNKILSDTLQHPHDEVYYIAAANNPSTYEYLSQISDSIYPSPLAPVPERIAGIVHELKKQYGWVDYNNHPMVINSPLLPIRSRTPVYDDENTLNDFFIATNPDYLQGQSLLVYLPLESLNMNMHDQNTQHYQHCFYGPDLRV